MREEGFKPIKNEVEVLLLQNDGFLQWLHHKTDLQAFHSQENQYYADYEK
jgi:hypothetical protein